MIIHRARGPERLAPTRSPLDAVLVAIDSAKRSGYATYIAGRLWDYGEVNARLDAERARVFTDAIGAAYMRGLPIAALLEVPWGGYQSAALSLHVTAKDWRRSWEATGQPADRLVERTVGQWRRQLFGGRTLAREAARVLEAQYAAQCIARDLGARRFLKPEPGPDANAAVCIGQTILRAGELRTLLGCELVVVGVPRAL
jgi:hypothetical protein